MKSFRIVNDYRKFLKNVRIRNYCSVEKGKEKSDINKIRNIGILAHIDAGKTTTTERMLFYSGTIRSMGEVHHGNTVTDYMEQERQRGITITSAAVSFPWQGYQINLIDTPGHIDFTMEVEQSLAVLDGAVVVLDGSAGVEAQTLTVWRQANWYKVPRILYLNKMDRNDSDARACARSVEDKLRVTSLLLHEPIHHEGKLIGLTDLITLEKIIWTKGRGQYYTKRKLTEKNDGKKWELAINEHRKIIDTLSSLDDKLADKIIQQESLDNLDYTEIIQAIRRCTINMTLFPILCGSSYKNIGVQTLIDGVISYLPSPGDKSGVYRGFGSDLSARAFKVQHDDQRGVLTFLRVYSGEISKGQKIYNLARDKSEQTGSLYVALADEYQPVEKVTSGNIAVVSALKATMSGDLITASQAAANRAREKLAAMLRDPSVCEELVHPGARHRLQAMDADPTAEDIADVLLGIGNTIPEPVFLCSIEPPSAAYLNALETALEELKREDPSLRVTTDEDTGQMVLAGMGELHLEIIKERIIREYKIDVELGPPQISYKETLIGTAKQTMTIDRKIGSAKQMTKVVMSAKTVKGVTQDKVLRLDKTADSAANLAHVHPRYMQAIRRGVDAALLHGPKLGCPLVDVQVTLHWFEVGRGTSESVVAAAVTQCLRKVFEEAESVLLEPVMFLELVCPETHSSRLLADLARRRVDIQHHSRHKNKERHAEPAHAARTPRSAARHARCRGTCRARTSRREPVACSDLCLSVPRALCPTLICVIECLAPLSELLGYSSTLRYLSSGLASFTMEFHSNRQMAPHDEEKAIRTVTGF